MRSWVLTFGVLAVGALPAAAGTPCAAVATFGDRDGASCVRLRSAALDELNAMAAEEANAASGRFDGRVERREGGGTRSEFRPVFFGGPPPVLYTPPMPLPPNPLTPSLGDAGSISAPIPQAAPVAAAPAPVRAAPPVAAPVARGPGSSSPGGDPDRTPCADLRDKARRLRSAADQCDEAVAAGDPYCNVTPTFRRPSLPWEIAPGSARSYADEFDRIANEGNERICAERGGEGQIPSGDGSAGKASLRRAVRYYTQLCSDGDSYACDARQITELCFNNSPTNACVRDCLVDNDARCAAMTDEDARFECRKDNHWFCYGYEASSPCRKFVPNVVTELRCVRSFPGSDKFLPPILR